MRLLSRSLASLATGALLALGGTAAAGPATLGITDLTLGGPTPANLFLGHSVSLDIGGDPGETPLVLLSPTPPPANPPLIGGVPLAVDPATMLVIPVGLALPPSGALSLPVTVPTLLPGDLTIYMQVVLLAPQTLKPRLTNGLAPITSSEPFVSIDHGTQSGHPLADSGGTQLITNAASWTAFWTQHTSIYIPAPPVPAVDFNEHAVLAYFDGVKSSSGYESSIVNVVFNGSGLDVSIASTAPGFGCGVLTVITYPYDLVVIDAAVAAGVSQVTEHVEFIDCP